MAERIWTTRKKWLGNLVPILCFLPLAIIAGAIMLKARGITTPGVVIFAVAVIVGWLAVNQFGLMGNENLRERLQRKLLAKAMKNTTAGIFVGFARPAYIGLLDAHEDLGFLFLEGDHLEYRGEQYNVSLHRFEIKEVRFRPNIHTYLGLGRWVSIEAIVANKPVRVLVEPRQANTLLANRRRGSELKGRLEKWLLEKERARV